MTAATRERLWLGVFGVSCVFVIATAASLIGEVMSVSALLGTVTLGAWSSFALYAAMNAVDARRAAATPPEAKP